MHVRRHDNGTATPYAHRRLRHRSRRGADRRSGGAGLDVARRRAHAARFRGRRQPLRGRPASRHRRRPGGCAPRSRARGGGDQLRRAGPDARPHGHDRDGRRAPGVSDASRRSPRPPRRPCRRGRRDRRGRTIRRGRARRAVRPPRHPGRRGGDLRRPAVPPSAAGCARPSAAARRAARTGSRTRPGACPGAHPGAAVRDDAEPRARAARGSGPCSRPRGGIGVRSCPTDRDQGGADRGGAPRSRRRAACRRAHVAGCLCRAVAGHRSDTREAERRRHDGRARDAHPLRSATRDEREEIHADARRGRRELASVELGDAREFGPSQRASERGADSVPGRCAVLGRRSVPVRRGSSRGPRSGRSRRCPRRRRCARRPAGPPDGTPYH